MIIRNILCSVLCSLLLVNFVYSKSVYVISNINSSQLQAYEVQGTSLSHQIDYSGLSYNGAVGLAIDTNNEFLFVTFEGRNIIELVDAKTMTNKGTIIASGASNLAGIVVDQANQKVYAVDRGQPFLYVYDWYPDVPELIPDGDPVQLDGFTSGGAWGIALDEINARLYVTADDTTIRYYNISDWAHDPNSDINIANDAVGIGIDVPNQYVYTGDWGGSTYLTQYDLSADPNDAETNFSIGSSIAGIAVDQQTGLVYLTTYGSGGSSYYPPPSTKDRLLVYDPIGVDPNLVWVSDDIGNPAGVAVTGGVGYKPDNFTATKTDDVDPNGCVEPNDLITYTICFAPGTRDEPNVMVTDTLPPQVDFVSAHPDTGGYDFLEHSYTWDIGLVAIEKVIKKWKSC